MGGGAGSKEVIDSSSAVPISPPSSAFFKATKFGSNLRLKPIIIKCSFDFVFSRHRFARAKLKSTGFSQRIAFPAIEAFSIKSECVSVELAIKIASIELSSKIASTDLGLTLYNFAKFLAFSSTLSATATNCDPSSCTIVLACTRPMRPAPISPTVNITLLQF